MIHPSIYSFIKDEEGKFETDEVRLGDNWSWNFRTHVQMIFHLKNGVFFTGENNWLRAFKNIMRPMLNLAYWTEDLEVKDITFFIENQADRALSFLIKKYHDEVYVREHNIDTLLDEITESDIDYGGVLVQRTKEGAEVLPLQSIAFCDQTDIMGGPIAFKVVLSPDKLRSMSKLGWGEKSNGADISLDELATLAEYDKDPAGMSDTKKNKVPGKVVEVYIIRGPLPEHYLKDNDNMEDVYNQLQVRAFYVKRNGQYNGKEGVCLYRKAEDEGNLKFHTSSKVYGRALGNGEGEALLHPQIWTNFLTIHKTALLEAGSKVPLMTDDPNFQNRNKIQDMENLEIVQVSPDTKLPPTPIQTIAVANIQLYKDDINGWYEHAQLTGSAFDPILGKEANSGTTFRGQERVVAQGRGMHDRRRGQRAKFIEEIYRDWFIPDMIREIVGGKEFLATLTAEDITWVADQLADRFANEKIKGMLFKGKLPTKEDQETFRQTFKKEFAKGSNKKLIKILADEFRGVAVRMGINVANKQKDLVNLSDKLLSIFQAVFANPAGFQQAMQIPALAKSFQDILEFSGLNQADFLSLLTPPPQPIAMAPSQPQPMMMNKPVEA